MGEWKERGRGIEDGGGAMQSGRVRCCAGAGDVWAAAILVASRYVYTLHMQCPVFCANKRGINKPSDGAAHPPTTGEESNLPFRDTFPANSQSPASAITPSRPAATCSIDRPRQ